MATARTAAHEARIAECFSFDPVQHKHPAERQA
jgi:hypothetical protein